MSGRLSDQPLEDNGWGYDPDRPVCYHTDGPIGTAISSMGDQARMDLDGQPLANVLGRVATDVVMGRLTTQQGLQEFQAIRDRLPETSHARQQMDRAIADIDAPASPAPPIPAGTPQPLHDLALDLHAVPLARRAGNEETALATILNDLAAGNTGGYRLLQAVRDLRNRHHESLGEAGKMEIDRAVTRAHKALEDLWRTDRQALYRPRS